MRIERDYHQEGAGALLLQGKEFLEEVFGQKNVSQQKKGYLQNATVSKQLGRGRLGNRPQDCPGESRTIGPLKRREFAFGHHSKGPGRKQGDCPWGGFGRAKTRDRIFPFLGAIRTKLSRTAKSLPGRRNSWTSRGKKDKNR